MPGRARPWLIVAPLALAGGQAAHALADRLPLGDPDGAGELLAHPATGSFLVAPLAAMAAGLLLAALASHACAPRPGPPPAWPFATLPVAVYLAQEQIEFALVLGRAAFEPWSEPAVYAGLLLQLPLALAAYLIARLLLRVAEAIGQRLRRRCALRAVMAARFVRPGDRVCAAPPAYRRQAPRGPPLLVA